MDGFQVLTDKSKLNMEMIHKYLSQESYWARGRSLKDVQTSVDASHCYGGFLNDRQIAFARLVTDFVTFAWLADVFVLPEYQGNGYAKKLLQTVIRDPKLASIPTVLLRTLDAHGLYRKFDFELLERPEMFMLCNLQGQRLGDGVF